MTKQEAFDKALLGIWNQKAPSYRNSVCMYRSPEGYKCAVGHLISDQFYEKNIKDKVFSNGNSLNTSEVSDPKAQLPVSIKKLGLDFLYKLQLAHDDPAETGSEFMGIYLNNMLRVGREFNLNVSKVRRRIRMLKDK